jgi:hypothetical protein
MAQTNASVDSTFLSLSAHLSEKDRQQVHNYHSFIADSGTYHRMDSLHCPLVIIEGFVSGNTFETREYYFHSADSSMSALYEYGSFDNMHEMDVHYTYNELRKIVSKDTAITRRRCRFLQFCYYGDVKFNRGHYRKNLVRRLKKYEFVTFVNNETGKVETQVSLPPRRRIFIMFLKSSMF